MFRAARPTPVVPGGLLGGNRPRQATHVTRLPGDFAHPGRQRARVLMGRIRIEAHKDHFVVVGGAGGQHTMVMRCVGLV